MILALYGLFLIIIFIELLLRNFLCNVLLDKPKNLAQDEIELNVFTINPFSSLISTLILSRASVFKCLFNDLIYILCFRLLRSLAGGFADFFFQKKIASCKEKQRHILIFLNWMVLLTIHLSKHLNTPYLL